MPSRRDKPASRAAASVTELTAKAIGAAIRARRTELRLTQEAIAERMGSDFRQVQRIEAGATNPTLDSLVRIADALQTTPARLFSRETELRISEAPPRASDLRTHGGDDNMKYGARQRTRADEEAIALRDLGRRISAARRRLSMTQATTATSAGLSVQHFQRIEHGKQNPTMRTLVGIAHAFGMTLRELLAGPLAP